MATKLTRHDVFGVARLAHLTLTEAEVETFGGQLERILDFVNDIRQADTTGVEPAARALAGTLRWRDDRPAPSLDRDTALASAPDADRPAGLFRVPKVL